MAIFNTVYGGTGGGGGGRLPKEYQEVEYIQSSGTQYINTGYSNSNGIYVETDFEYTSIPSQQIIMGAEGQYAVRIFLGAKSQHNIWSGGVDKAGGGNISANTRYNYKATFASGSGADLYVNDTPAISTTTTNYSSLDYYLFAGNSQNSAIVNAYVKLYTFKMYTPDKTTLVRDFIPCYRKSDDVIGLYDLVNDTFYTNSGTGTFTKGPDVN